MPKKDSLALALDCLTARGRALELNSQLSGGSGGCRWPLMPALGTGRLQFRTAIFLFTWEDARGIARGIRVRSRVGMNAGCAWDVTGCHVGCTRDLREIAREIFLGISRNPPPLPRCWFLLLHTPWPVWRSGAPFPMGDGRGTSAIALKETGLLRHSIS